MASFRPGIIRISLLENDLTGASNSAIFIVSRLDEYV